MKHSKTFWSVLVIVAVLIVVVGLLAWNRHRAEAPVPAQAGSTTVAQATAVTPTMVSVSATSAMTAVSGSYPQFPQADAAFNQKIASAITSDISDFNQSATADYSAQLSAEGASFQQEFNLGGYYYFDVTPTVVQSTTEAISVIIREEGFTGGAHPFHNVFTFNYDVKNQKELALTDLVSLQSASDQARAILGPKLAAAGDETTPDSNLESMIQQGTDPTVPDNFNAFTFTGSPVPGAGQITLYFGEYQVAPYVYGEQDVTINEQ